MATKYCKRHKRYGCKCGRKRKNYADIDTKILCAVQAMQRRGLRVSPTYLVAWLPDEVASRSARQLYRDMKRLKSQGKIIHLGNDGGYRAVA